MHTEQIRAAQLNVGQEDEWERGWMSLVSYQLLFMDMPIAPIECTLCQLHFNQDHIHFQRPKRIIANDPTRLR